MLDDRFDDQLRDAAREYNTPPVTPRAEMWERIVAARAETAEEKKAVRRFTFRRFRLPIGIAALLALGIGLGRLSAPQADRSTPVIATSVTPPRATDVAYRIATTEHLGQSEAFLTLFRASLRGGGNQQLAAGTARQLLATNRLLLDSPAASEARTRLLLQDLELVLAEIAQLAPRPRSPDLDLINEGLERGAVMSRLRTAVPSGASPTQGAL